MRLSHRMARRFTVVSAAQKRALCEQKRANDARDMLCGRTWHHPAAARTCQQKVEPRRVGRQQRQVGLAHNRVQMATRQVVHHLDVGNDEDVTWGGVVATRWRWVSGDSWKSLHAEPIYSPGKVSFSSKPRSPLVSRPCRPSCDVRVGSSSHARRRMYSSSSDVSPVSEAKRFCGSFIHSNRFEAYFSERGKCSAARSA